MAEGPAPITPLEAIGAELVAALTRASPEEMLGLVKVITTMYRERVGRPSSSAPRAETDDDSAMESEGGWTSTAPKGSFVKMSGKELISKVGLRLDGRRADELRRIRCKLGVFSKPDGSAYIEQGLTKVLAAVYGPHQVRCNRSRAQSDAVVLNCQFSMAVFSTSERKKRPRGDRKSTEMSLHLRQALLAAIEVEKYPWSQLDVYVEVLQADGGIFPACVNAATLALIDAGIPLKEFVCACTASVANNNQPMVDISHEEEVIGGPTLTVVALPMSQKVVLMEMSRRFHLDHLQMVLEKALEGCKNTKNILDEAVRNHVAEVGSSTGWASSGEKIKR